MELACELRTKFGTWQKDILHQSRPLSVLQWRHLGQSFPRVSFRYRFRVGPTTLLILVWSYLILSGDVSRRVLEPARLQKLGLDVS